MISHNFIKLYVGNRHFNYIAILSDVKNILFFNTKSTKSRVESSPKNLCDHENLLMNS